MGLVTWKIYFAVQNLLQSEEGQDLVEYALILALIALAATVGMKSLADSINSAFQGLGSLLGSYT